MANNKTTGAAARKNVSNTRRTAIVVGESAKNSKKPLNVATVKKGVSGQSLKKPTAGSDMVTMTQAEFDAILGAIGKLATEKGSSNPNSGNEQLDTFELQDDVAEHRARNQRVHISNEPQYFPEEDEIRDQQLYQQQSFTNIPRAHLTVAERKRLEMNGNSLQSQVNDWGPFSGQDSKTGRHEDATNNVLAPSAWSKAPLPSQPVGLSIMDKKRMQWEQEKAEQMHLQGYNPWGRGGAGAPIRDQFGNVVNDYNSRKSAVRDSYEVQQQSHVTSRPSFTTIDPPSHHNAVTPGLNPLYKSQSHPDRVNALQSAVEPGSLPPAAIRSSFAIGNSVPDGDRYSNQKDLQTRKWREELEQQILEQKKRKEDEQKRWKDDSSSGHWADRTVVKPQPVLPPGGGYQHAPDSHHTDTYNAESIQSRRVTSAPDDTRSNGAFGDTLGVQQQEPPNSFIRGQNVPVDPETKRELDDKRKKYLENQEYLRHQIEERERLKREEKERELRQDRLEEQKMLQKQQQQQQYTQQHMQQTVPQQLPKQTQLKTPHAQPSQQTIEELHVVQRPVVVEQLERKQLGPQSNTDDREKVERQLHDALEVARIQAEREKHERWLQKLSKGNHDISKLRAQFEEKLSSHYMSAVPMSSNEDHSVVLHHHVEPDHVPGLTPVETVPRVTSLAAVHSDDDVDEGYVENRVITPTTYRQKQKEPLKTKMKEFGTQTEIHLDRPASRQESVAGVEYRPPVARKKSETNTKRVRVVSAAKPSDSQSSVVSQSNGRYPARRDSSTRDLKKTVPTHTDQNTLDARKKQRRLERQQALMAQVAANARHVPRGYIPSMQTSSREQPSIDTARPGRNTFRVEAKVATTASGDPYPDNEVSHGHKYAAGSSPVRSRSNSVHNVAPPIPSSPPIPSVKHRMNAGRGPATRVAESKRDSYGDDNELNILSSRNDRVPGNNDFVPFMRTSEVLDPAHAESPLPISREPTVMVKARRAYQHELNPAKYGMPMDHRLNNIQNDPQPSQRGQVLQHLSTLRQRLMEKQMETMSSVHENGDDSSSVAD